MRTGTFYLSYKPSPEAVVIPLSDGACVYIRVTESDKDLMDALDEATPRNEEMVMNTHPLLESEA